MKQLLILSVLFVISFKVQADVDLRNANFFHSWIDGEISSEDFFLQLQRSYNSRVNRVGYFGQGWCSPIEAKLTVNEDKSLSIQNCGSGSVTTYNTTGASTWSFAEQTIQKVDEFYILKVKGVSQLQFTSDGKLDTFWVQNEKAKLRYVQAKLNLIETAKGNVLFKITTNGKIESAKLPSGKMITYKYENDNLVKVQNQWGSVYHFAYDNKGNLVNAKWPDKTEIVLTYNKEKDWVTSMKSRDLCLEKYSYENVAVGADSKVTSKVLRSCPKLREKSKVVEMLFDKSNRMKSIRQSEAKDWKEIKYNEFSKPTEISDASGVLAKFEYDKQGNLIKKIADSETTQFVLNSKNEVEKIKTADKQFSMTYDDRGRVQSLVLVQDGKTSELSISYVNQSEKLKGLELKGKGQIQYRYSDSGSLEETKSLPSAKVDDVELQMQVNMVYGLYSMLTDEAVIFGGIE